MVVAVVRYLEYNVDERIKTFLMLTFEIGAYMVGKFIYAFVVFVIGQEVLYSSVFICHFFADQHPAAIMVLFVKADFHIRSRRTGVYVENVARQLM